MDSLKVVPQVFFDLIARVVPGSVTLVLALIIVGKSWQDWLQTVLGPSLAQDSPFCSAAIFVSAAYIVGQFVSTPGKHFPKLVAWLVYSGKRIIWSSNETK